MHDFEASLGLSDMIKQKPNVEFKKKNDFN